MHHARRYNPAMKHAVFVAALAMLLSAAMPADAQWLKTKTPGIPRTKDGKPNLTAPAPKAPDGRPDLSGIWRTDALAFSLDVTTDLKPGEILPWAEALAKERTARFATDHPLYRCMPEIGPNYNIEYVQVRAERRHAGDAARGRTVPADPDRRPRAARGSAADVDGLFSRSLGRQHDGRRERRLQRSHVARLRRTPAHRSAAHDRAVSRARTSDTWTFRSPTTIRRPTRVRGRSRCTPI